MELFKKKPKASARGKIELVANSDGSVQLAFGLNWSPIVSTGGRQAAIRTVKQKGATHFLYRGQQVGYGVIEAKKDELQGAQIFPAAQVAARQYGGDAIHAYKISQGEYWLAVVRNGQPTSIDEFIHAEYDATLLDQAERIINGSRDDGVAFNVFTNIDQHNFAGNVSRAGPEDLMMATGQASEQLEQIPKGSSLHLPKPVVFSLVAALTLALGQAGWKQYEKHKAAKIAAANLPPVDEPPEVAWARAVKEWEQKKTAPKSDGFRDARESLGTVPARWNGWDLKEAQCSAGEPTGGQATAATPGTSGVKPVTEIAPGQAKRTWSCEANFERSRLGAFNTDMVDVLPKEWNVTFQPLNKMQARWSVGETVTKLKIAELNTVAFHMVDTVSKFQKLSPIFSQEIALAFVPTPVPAPKKSDGKVYPADPAASGVKSSPISVKGPLRSIDALLTAEIPADWTKISLVVGAGSGSKNTSINQSQISAEASGVIYAKTN